MECSPSLRIPKGRHFELKEPGKRQRRPGKEPHWEGGGHTHREGQPVTISAESSPLPQGLKVRPEFSHPGELIEGARPGQ